MKLYFDSLTTLKVIHAESPVVIFFGTYGIGLSISGLYQIRACARASKFKIAQNQNLNNGEHVSGNFEHLKIYRKLSKFLHDLDSSYHNWQFPLISVILDLL